MTSLWGGSMTLITDIQTLGAMQTWEENMFDKLSTKLSTYMREIEYETSRQIVIENTVNSELSGELAGFRLDGNIHVLINLDYLASNTVTDQDVERTIAHESTHGLLLYGRGYCHPSVFGRELTEEEHYKAQWVFNMVDDIVVNKIIQVKGFPPFSPVYLQEVEKEINAANEGIDIHNQISNEFLLKDTFMVMRYITAWGFLEYFKLEQEVRGIITIFLQSFQKSYPEQYQTAEQVKNIILRNDISTSDGQCNAIKEILDLFGLLDLVKPVK